jgi:hypothetical protein
MAEEDGDVAIKEWAADLPGSEDERDRAAGEDENPDAEPQASAAGGQGEPASTHLSEDLPDDDDVVILEPLAVIPLAFAPPAVGAAPPLRARKRATEQAETAKKHQQKKQKTVPEAAG